MRSRWIRLITEWQCGAAEWYVGTRGGYSDQAAIKLGKCGSIQHMTSAPFTFETLPFPKGYRVVLADSMVQAKKQAGAKDGYNMPLAAYAFGLWLIQENFPTLAPKIQRLRDVVPARLGISDAEVFRIIKSLPESVSRNEILAMLPEKEAEIRGLFRFHNEPKDGYKVRRRLHVRHLRVHPRDLAGAMLREGDIQGFGKLISLHHDGDRVTRLVNGEMVPLVKDYADARSRPAHCGGRGPGHCGKPASARSGGCGVYGAGDRHVVDLALQVEGVAGAGLVGAGLGGSMAVLVKAENAEIVVRTGKNYYEPKGLPLKAEIVSAVGGAGSCPFERDKSRGMEGCRVPRLHPRQMETPATAGHRHRLRGKANGNRFRHHRLRHDRQLPRPGYRRIRGAKLVACYDTVAAAADRLATTAGCNAYHDLAALLADRVLTWSRSARPAGPTSSRRWPPRGRANTSSSRSRWKSRCAAATGSSRPAAPRAWSSRPSSLALRNASRD